MSKIKKLILKCWQYELVHMAVYAILVNIIVECLNQRSITGLMMPFIHPVIFFYDALIIMFTMSFVLFIKRKIFGYGLVSFIWILLALINYVVLNSRKTPFTAMDIYLLNDAMKVIPIYLSLFQIILIIAGIIVLVAFLVFVFIKAPFDKHKINYIHSLGKCAGILIVLFLTTKLYIFAGFLDVNFGNIANAYKEYGFAYCFSCSVVDRGISKSSNYSTEYMDGMKEKIDDGQHEEKQQRPNIVFLQLESFMNPNRIKNVSFSENPVPNFEKLYSECASGFLSVPCFGAGTANTEFEIQTGINLDDFGPGEYPYRTVMQSQVCESMAYDLKELGYKTHALHNNDGTFYDRYKVFANLGYDTFTSVEYMKDIEETPTGWAKDKILTSEISKILDSTEGADYVYTISVQGHGDYPDEMPKGYKPSIQVEGFFDESKTTAFQYYVNQIKEMDDFIGELTEELSKRNEPVILVMYGDHLPGFDFSDDDLNDEDIYNSQYIIWSNYDYGGDITKTDMQAYQLSSYVFEKLNISQGFLTKFHQKQKDSTDYLKDLKILEYDMLYGDYDINGGVNPYKATDIKMGTYDVVIDKAYNYKDYICIEGDNFNDSSVVYINYDEQDTEVINNHLIRVKDASLKAGDIVMVAQQGKDKIKLSTVRKQIINVDE